MVGIKLIKIIFTLVFMIILDMSFQRDIEATERKQAVLSVNHISQCFKSTLKGLEPKDITDALNVCASSSLVGGSTGDAFVIDTRNKELYWDNSIDCKPESDASKFMTLEGVCSRFADPQSCNKAVKEMLNGTRVSTSWNFDGSEEWIETKTLPSDTYGFNGKFRGDMKERPFQLIIAQGVQKDEVMAVYSFSFLLFKVIFGVAMLIFVADTVYTRKLVRRFKGLEDDRKSNRTRNSSIS